MVSREPGYKGKRRTVQGTKVGYWLVENLDIKERGELFKELRLDIDPRERIIVIRKPVYRRYR